MSANSFILSEPIAYSRRRPKSTYALTLASVLTLSGTAYSVSTTTGDNSNFKSGNIFNNEICSTDVILTQLLSSDFSYKEQMLKRLNNLYAELQYGNWDGYGSVPIETGSYINTKELIKLMTGTQLSHWHLFPSPNGTFMLSAASDDVASISIGNDEFSFAAMKDGIELMGQEKFDAQRATSIIRNIHSLLRYNG